MLGYSALLKVAGRSGFNRTPMFAAPDGRVGLESGLTAIAVSPQESISSMIPVSPESAWTRAGRVPSLFLTLLITACGDPGTGPLDVSWYRTPCERCRMVVSDRHHAAEVRVRKSNDDSKVFFFDDLGCALIWLEERPAKDDPSTEIWVSDWRTGDWLDARTAHYLPGQVTPMEYGLGAQPGLAPGALSFSEARQHILDVERRYNVHGVHGIHADHNIFQGHLEPPAPPVER